MIKEILLDIAKIVPVDMNVHYMVAVVQWRGKIIGRPTYQPTPAELNADREGLLHGMSMIPEPPSDWEAVPLEFVPKANGVLSKDDMPIAYFLISEKGNGVAFPRTLQRRPGRLDAQRGSHRPSRRCAAGGRLIGDGQEGERMSTSNGEQFVELCKAVVAAEAEGDDRRMGPEMLSSPSSSTAGSRQRLGEVEEGIETDQSAGQGSIVPRIRSQRRTRLYATPEDVEALRQLAGVLVMLFGSILTVDLD